MHLIEKFIDSTLARPVRVDVIGDVMIDEYYDVSATRISPEFPIPVMTSDHDTPTAIAPGGAANVCYQFKHWNASPSLHSLADSGAALSIRQMLGEKAVCNLVGLGLMGRVPRKKRFYDGKHPSFRWDIERPDFGLPQQELDGHRGVLVGRYFQGEKDADVMVLSDYDKGLFHTRDPWCPFLAKKIPSIVDPKKGPLEKWKGCTVFKPNNIEAQALSGLSDWRDQCNFFFDALGCEWVVITQGGRGVTARSTKGDLVDYKSPFKLSAESVIGAGDCFAAFLAMAFALKFPLEECVEIAFTAGATYVQQDRNKPITAYDLLKTVDPIAAKYLPVDPAEREGTLVFTNGCFDLLHAGHIQTLQYARKQGDRLMVAINSDSSVRRLKGDSRPIVGEDDRMTALAALECVDHVGIFYEDTPKELIDEVKPDLLVKGSQYERRDVVGFGMVKSVALAPMVDGVSTTKIVEKIRSASEAGSSSAS